MSHRRPVRFYGGYSMHSISYARLMKLKPSNTAIGRVEASPIARKLVTGDILKHHHISTILDYGYGYGCDVSYYEDCDFNAKGFDPHGPSKFSAEVTGEFDLVVCQFVLNVIADSRERARVCEKLFDHAKVNGFIIVGLQEVVWVFWATSEGWKHACEHLEPQIFLVA